MIAPSPAARPATRAWQNFFWLVGGRIIRGGISLVIGVWMARYLGPADYGILNSAIAIVTMLLALGGLGLDSVVRQELVRDPANASMILGTCMALRVAAGVLSYLVLFFLTAGWAGELREVWLITGLMLITHVPLSLDFWFQAQLQLRVSTIAQNVAFAISAALRALFIMTGSAVVWFAVAIVLEGPISGLFLFFSHGRLSPETESFHWDTRRAKSWLRACWPLLVANLFAVGFGQMNQVLIVRLSDLNEAGRFAAASRVFELGTFVLTAFVTTRIAEIAASRDSGKYAARRTLRHILGSVSTMAWGMAIPLALAAPLLVRFLFGHEFRHTEAAIRWIVFGLLPFGLGLVRHEYWIGSLRTQRLLVANVAGAILNLALAFALIPKWGAAGAAAATATSLLFANLGATFFWSDARDFAFWQLHSIAVTHLWRRLRVMRKKKTR
ncbi:MAG TPA: flippase [Opitutaceae bacterium]|nr:flippase [Opitutaceae bacterium]